MIKGYVEAIRPFQVRGWVYNTDAPDEPVTVTLTVGGEEIATQQAAMFRPDLLSTGKGNGRHGFVFDLDRKLPMLAPDWIEVHGCLADGNAQPLPPLGVTVAAEPETTVADDMLPLKTSSTDGALPSRARDAATIPPVQEFTAPPTSPILERVRHDLKEIITSALLERYVSISSHQQFLTGNFYQSITLGTDVITGFRSDRSNLFAAFDFSGHKVLDCGCNIGELSRLARGRGASLVDGYEYDPYFVQMASLITAYNGTSRVSFYQKDLTDPRIFKETYDIILAFSVFPYIITVIEEISKHTTTALVLETHELNEDLYVKYVNPVKKYFPYHSLVKLTDHGHGEGQRAVFLFTKKEESLFYGDLMKLTVDLPGSTFTYMDRIEAVLGAHFPVRAADLSLLSAVVDRALTETEDDLQLNTDGHTYWLLFLKGYMQYRESGYLANDNAFVQGLRRALDVENYDPALRQELIDNKDTAQARVLLRFQDGDRFCGDDKYLLRIDPIKIINPSQSTGRYRFKYGDWGSVMYCDDLDGYHRIFWARVFGRRQVATILPFTGS